MVFVSAVVALKRCTSNSDCLEKTTWICIPEGQEPDDVLDIRVGGVCAKVTEHPSGDVSYWCRDESCCGLEEPASLSGEMATWSCDMDIENMATSKGAVIGIGVTILVFLLGA